MAQEEQGPQSLVQFITMIIKAYITGIPSIIKGMIVSVIISAIITNGIHFYLMGWVNDGWNYGNVPALDGLIFMSGQETSPRIMLFYFMITYLFWWVIGMFRSRGIGKTVSLIATTPIWIVKSLTSIGFAVLPMIMGGIAVSFVLGLTVLTNVTALTMFLMTITVLISQEESLMVMGLQLGFKDVSGLVNRGQPAQLPPAMMPAAAIIGAGIGFGYMSFFNTNPTVIGAIALISIAGLVYMFIRNRRGQTAAVYITLFFLVSAFALMAPTVLADDGGIPENGGWSNLANNGWLINELIRRGYPASAAAVLAASWISGLFSPPVLSKVKPLKDDYVQPDWKWATKNGKVDLPDEFVKDPAGRWVHKVTGEHYSKEQTGTGLSKVVIDAEDSPDLGDRVRVFTMEPPTDKGKVDDIADGISGLDDFYTDKLHPDNWKNLKPGQKGVVMQEVNKILQKELGVDYEFTVLNDPDKGLGGSYTPEYTRTNPDGTKTKVPATIEINSNGDAFADPRTAIRTLVHEARHAYQDVQANDPKTDYQKMCNYNNKNYDTSSHDYVRYKEQFIERDSRKFGHNTANQVIENLNSKWGH